MIVNDVLDAVGEWEGAMPVVVAVQRNGAEEWRSIESIGWEDSDAGPMVVIRFRENLSTGS